MDKSIKFLLFLLLTFFFTSCNSQDVEIKLTIHNKSGTTLDSIRVYDIFESTIKYYNIKADTIIVKVHKDKKFKIPKGERPVFLVTAFKDDYYYSHGAGFIGFPGTRLEDEYNIYIYDKYITNKKDYKPISTDWREKLSEYPKG